MFKKGAKVVFIDASENNLNRMSRATGIPSDVMYDFATHQPLVVDDISLDMERIFLHDTIYPSKWWIWSKYFKLHCVWGET